MILTMRTILPNPSTRDSLRRRRITCHSYIFMRLNRSQALVASAAQLPPPTGPRQHLCELRPVGGQGEEHRSEDPSCMSSALFGSPGE